MIFGSAYGTANKNNSVKFTELSIVNVVPGRIELPSKV